MMFLSYAYRFVSNFVFLALVYFSLNFLEKYQQRAMVAILVLVYAGDACGIGAAVVLFLPAHRAAGDRGAAAVAAAGEGPNSAAARKQIVTDVSALRHAGEIKSYIDLLFLALVSCSASPRS